MNGQQLWHAVRREFKKNFYLGTIHRIENALERGMPDVVWGAMGQSGWIELKGEGDSESPLQRVFRNRWNTAGGNAVVLTAKLNKFIVTDLHGSKEFETMGKALGYIV